MCNCGNLKFDLDMTGNRDQTGDLWIRAVKERYGNNIGNEVTVLAYAYFELPFRELNCSDVETFMVLRSFLFSVLKDHGMEAEFNRNDPYN